MNRTSALLIAISLLLAGACRTSGTAADSQADSSAPAAAAGGDRAVEACLTLTDTVLERKGGHALIRCTITNTSTDTLDAEVRVQTFDGSGKQLAGGASAWTSLKLKAGARQTMQFEGLPQGTESWTLIARKR